MRKLRIRVSHETNHLCFPQPPAHQYQYRTPDSQWLVYDVRPSGASFTGETIERVNVSTGEVEVIYRATHGAHVGVVTVHPAKDKYVFIHGPKTRMQTGNTIFTIAGRDCP